MGVVKQAMLEQAEKDAQEAATHCDSCGADMTQEQLNEMPFEDGEYVFKLCPECREEAGE